jgi:hypothetical protein
MCLADAKMADSVDAFLAIYLLLTGNWLIVVMYMSIGFTCS